MTLYDNVSIRRLISYSTQQLYFILTIIVFYILPFVWIYTGKINNQKDKEFVNFFFRSCFHITASSIPLPLYNLIVIEVLLMKSTNPKH